MIMNITDEGVMTPFFIYTNPFFIYTNYTKGFGDEILKK